MSDNPEAPASNHTELPDGQVVPIKAGEVLRDWFNGANVQGTADMGSEEMAELAEWLDDYIYTAGQPSGLEGVLVRLLESIENLRKVKTRLSIQTAWMRINGDEAAARALLEKLEGE